MKAYELYDPHYFRTSSESSTYASVPRKRSDFPYNSVTSFMNTLMALCRLTTRIHSITRYRNRASGQAGMVSLGASIFGGKSVSA
ncbi:MAG: hypothetical protein JWM11_4411 [Planctomycetaceae bacterium]|nr:hypothetical protein [Planctomycetaceae bacterium]